jgi:thiol-disulfide isomerase/thioredoxin
MNRVKLFFIFLLMVFCLQPVFSAQKTLPESTWFEIEQQGRAVIHVYFFWTNKCPHCLDMLPVVTQLAEKSDDIKLHSLQLIGEKENINRYQYMAMKLGQSAQSVPAILFCNSMRTGFDKQRTLKLLLNDIELCRQHIKETGSIESLSYQKFDHLQIKLPFIGTINTSRLESLPLITILIASIDAFNPCAFFVLLFLLSMMLHTHSRSRMLVIGMVFIFMSGIMYFLFMTAWLNLFRVIGQLDVITSAAGFVAVIIGLLNIKDFFWFKQGVSLVISDSAKQTLFQRMRVLLNSSSMPGVLMATISLALFANLYEFLCTAGFPMVYTRILTLADMPNWKYYSYLVLYNMVYILPLLFIVILFTWTMGSRKLQESDGRNLKFISGIMMLSLGGILLFSPDLLQNIMMTALVLLIVVLISLVIIILDKQIRK